MGIKIIDNNIYKEVKKEENARILADQALEISKNKEIISQLENLHRANPALNPMLNSPADITFTILEQILMNDLGTLIINYEFCNPPEDGRIYLDRIATSNPFLMANKISPLKRLEFEIALTPNVTCLAYCFNECQELEFVNFKDVSFVRQMQCMFAFAKKFNAPIGNWNTSNVYDMSCMFMNAERFNQPIGDWDTSKVTKMAGMFRFAYDFNQPIGDWNTSKVRTMDSMFYRAMDFNQPIGNWVTSNVNNMRDMFHGAEKFNQPIGDWDTSHVTDMRCMFYDAKLFNQPLYHWNLSRVEEMDNMFTGADSFSYPKPGF